MAISNTCETKLILIGFILHLYSSEFVVLADDSLIVGGSIRNIPSVFPSRLQWPGLHSPRKAWWAKEITPDFHVCGRLTERQIKYAAEAGFKSVVSLFTYPDEDIEDNFGGVHLPNTAEEQEIVEKIAELQFIALLDPMDEWASLETIEKFTAIVPHIKTPSLLHCDRGRTIAFVILLYMANQTRNNKDFQPRIHSKEFFEITAAMGLDFFSRLPLEVVAEVTGEPLATLDNKQVPRANNGPNDWLDYWVAHPVYLNWFTAGQIYKSHVLLLKEFEYKSVINLRPGVTENGVPSQEEVNLLNVKSYTGTYGNSHSKPRQSDERLRETLVKPNRPNIFISNTSQVNYERRNEEEFGDEIGYNSELEKEAFEKSGLSYFHLPFRYDVQLTAFEDFFREHKDTLLDIGKKGPVLVHCAIGLRAAMVAVLTAALQYNLSFDWALQRVKELGFGLSEETYPDVYKVYKDYLLSDVRVEL
ncbi:unnamed protein product [Lymnaea stagnalis]|uniref:Rhodanese domain-containing protein n=1 Tax=Lymnaea stagnalis TaxID=6523 RepID=A0AAV2H7D3_LYMST